jgi:hypothetical protein
MHCVFFFTLTVTALLNDAGCVHKMYPTTPQVRQVMFRRRCHASASPPTLLQSIVFVFVCKHPTTEGIPRATCFY